MVGLQAGVVPLLLGAPGCSLIVAPILSAPLPTANGTVDAPLTIPSTSQLIGVPTPEIARPLEPDPTGVTRDLPTLASPRERKSPMTDEAGDGPVLRVGVA